MRSSVIKFYNTRIEDPFIENPDYAFWSLRHPKLPESDTRSFLDMYCYPPNLKSMDSTQWIKSLEHTTRKVFLILEAAWKQRNCTLVDLKIEFGLLADGTIVVSDVIDNDSWRLWDPRGTEVSKQVFREGGALELVEENYARVAEWASLLEAPSPEQLAKE